MATFSWAVKRLRVFWGMGAPPLEVVADSSRRFVPFQLKQDTRRLRLAILQEHLDHLRQVTVQFFECLALGVGPGKPGDISEEEPCVRAALEDCSDRPH